MDIDREKQQKIIAKTSQLLSSTETKRMLLRFQRGVVDLENDRFGILKNSEFVEKFIEYLQTLYQKGPGKDLVKLLEKIGVCACDPEVELRERAVFILSTFIEKISHHALHPEFLEVVSRLLVNWLQIETEYLAGFPFICNQLQTILGKMLQMGLWYQAENLIIVLSQIQKGIIQKTNLMRKTIGKVHSGLAEEGFLKNLVDVYLDKNEDRRDIAKCLLMHFGSKAAAVLVQSLIDCQDREKRFALIEFIPSTGKVSLPVFDFCLKQKPPWYVIRNIIIIISRMEDPTLYEMVRPYLVHKDIRVQLQVLNCITKLGGGQIREWLIEALPLINDELKQQVVVQLGNLGGNDVGEALCALLEKRAGFALHVADELVLILCTKLKFTPSERAIKVIRELLAERRQRFGESDRILQVAQDTLVSMELKNTNNLSIGNLPASPFTFPTDFDAFRVPIVSEEEFDSLLKGDLPAAPEEPELEPAFKSAREEIKEETQPLPEKPRLPSKKEIIQAAEKNLADPGSAIHFALFAKLYEEMTTEEFTAFHGALSLTTYQQGDLIVARGDLQMPLFFFDSGNVNIVRNEAGQEVHLCALGAGDLIGSDIFLSGDPWSLSLYAGETVRARVFDMEKLLKMRVEFPDLAEKIFNFCAKYDFLPNLLRVLDAEETLGQESVRIESSALSKTPADDKVQQGILIRKLRGGLCFIYPVKTTEDVNVLLGKQLRLSIRLSSGVFDSMPATIVGIIRAISEPAESIVLVRFLLPLPDFLYSCESIEFPAGV